MTRRSRSPASGMNPAELAHIARAEPEHWWYRGMRSILSRVLSPYSRGRSIHRVLDAGCGTGDNAAWWQSRYGWHLFPTDLEATALQYARHRPLRNLVQANVGCLPFSDASFDLVFCLDVLVHLPCGDETEALSELFRVLRSGGLLVLRAAALETLRSRHSEFIEERQRFTRRRLMQTAVGSGFRVRHCTYANSLLLPVALAKFRLWEPLWRQPPASGLAPVPTWLNTLLSAVLALEAKWLGRGRSLPLGQSLILLGEKPATRPG